MLRWHFRRFMGSFIYIHLILETHILLKLPIKIVERIVLYFVADCMIFCLVVG